MSKSTIKKLAISIKVSELIYEGYLVTLAANTITTVFPTLHSYVISHRLGMIYLSVNLVITVLKNPWDQYNLATLTDQSVFIKDTQ